MISIIQMISIQLFSDGMFVFGSTYDNGSLYDDQHYLGLMRNRYHNRSHEEYSDESDYRRSDSSDSNYRDMLVIEISDDYEDRRPICRPRCLPKYKPKCKPKCLPKCKPKCIPKCKPKCKPKCIPKCIPVHHKKRNNIRKVYHGNINAYIQLIQNALVQGSNEIHKLSKCYLEDVKTRLLEGLQLMWKASESMAYEELKRFEKKLFDIVICHNKNILRDTEAVIISTNGEIYDDIVVNIKAANKELIKDMLALSIPPGPTPPPLASLIQLVNDTFADLTDRLPSFFKKPVQNEKNALQKIVNENRNSILKEISKLINEFEQKLTKFFVDLAENEIALIRSIIDQSSRKLLCDLEHVIHQIGQNIISILKGCNTTFRPQLLIGPQCGGWTNVSESELLYN
jgi:hypothetical protein